MCNSAPRRPREALNVHKLQVGKERRRFLHRADELCPMFESIYRNAAGSALERLFAGCNNLHKTKVGKQNGLPAPREEDLGVLALLAERVLVDCNCALLGEALFCFRAWLVACFLEPLVRSALADGQELPELMVTLNGGRKVCDSEVAFVEAVVEDAGLEDTVVAIALWYADVPSSAGVDLGGGGCCVQ